MNLKFLLKFQFSSGDNSSYSFFVWSNVKLLASKMINIGFCVLSAAHGSVVVVLNF